MSADAPNGTATLFRKIIHAIGIHYNLAKKNDDQKLYEIINKLAAEGHIVQRLKEALMGVKDIGNDGAHINENEPDMKQASELKDLIELTLKSTVLADKTLASIKEKHGSQKLTDK
jgi:hypothetical protein